LLRGVLIVQEGARVMTKLLGIYKSYIQNEVSLRYEWSSPSLLISSC
jgi:hypothetical protein